MKYSLILYPQYEYCGLGIFKDSSPCYQMTIENKKFSKECPQVIINLLSLANLKSEQLNFIGMVNHPAPLTTLRSIISFAKGYSYALQKPLIQIDGLDLFELELETNHAIIFDAFANQVFYIIKYDNKVFKGKALITDLCNMINAQNNQICITGPAIKKYGPHFLNNPKIQLKDNFEYNDLADIAKMILNRIS